MATVWCSGFVGGEANSLDCMLLDYIFRKYYNGVYATSWDTPMRQQQRWAHMPSPHHVWSWTCWNEKWCGQAQPEECTATQLIKSCQRHITTVYTEWLRLSQITFWPPASMQSGLDVIYSNGLLMVNWCTMYIVNTLRMNDEKELSVMCQYSPIFQSNFC